MSNEEKILSMLEKMQDGIDSLNSKFDSIEENRTPKPEKKLSQREVFMGLANLLNDDEREALGKYMAAEEARKAAIYG